MTMLGNRAAVNMIVVLDMGIVIVNVFLSGTGAALPSEPGKTAHAAIRALAESAHADFHTTSGIGNRKSHHILDDRQRPT